MPAPEEEPTAASSGTWRFPAYQDLGHAILFAGIGLSLYGLCTLNYPRIVLPALLLIVGVVAAERGGTMFFTTRKSEDDAAAADMGMGMPGMDGFDMDFGDFMENPIPSQFADNKSVKRLHDVIRQTWEDDVTPVWDEFELDGDVLVSYKLRAAKPGFFTDEGTKNKFHDKLVKALKASKGAWSTSFDVDDDSVTVTQKSALPRLALPPLWKVSHTPEEAGKAYKKFEMTLGPGEGGDMVTFRPQVFPHVAVIATSGGGKSVFLRACMEQMRALGGQILVGDGKGSDASTLRNEPGVIAIGRGSGSKGVEYIAAIEIAFRIMQQRQNTAAERKTADPDNWEDIPPVFLVLDEMKSVLKKWSTELDNKSFKAIESRVNQILALGRQLRVHVYTASQDVYKESIPPSWLTNIGMKISLGKPHHLTISKGFDESIRGDATRIAAGIDPNARGRGMIAGVDEETATATVTPYQGFLGYSPGEATPDFFDKDQLAQWNAFRKEVSESIPRMYSRKWFQIDNMSEAQEKQEKSTGEFGFIDFELFSVDEIASMPIINLDMRDENGDIVPDPAMRKYDPDPNNKEYVCRPVVRKETAVSDI